MMARVPQPAAQHAQSSEAGWNFIFASWLVAASSTLGALFLSEVMAVPACVLCWYQRIFMFPLALLLPLGLFPFDPKIVRYALPLAAVGWLIALWHVLLTHGLVPENVTPCVQGVPCAQNPIEWFGFLSIPHLSLLAFSVINALLFWAHLKALK